MAKGSIEWEHNPDDGLTLHIKPALGLLFNDETRRHAMASRKEMLLTLRSIIDVAITRLETKEKKTEKRGTKIEVK